MTGRLPEAWVDDVLSRVRLVDLIGRDVALVRKGREHVGRCPFHQEKTPSFTVNEGKGFYHCFGCSAHGGAVAYLMARGRATFREAMEDLAARVGVPMPEGEPRHGVRPLPPVARPSAEELAREDERSIERARALWRDDTRDPRGTPVEAYLRHRGLGAWVDDRIPPTLRFARLTYWAARKGAERPVDLGKWPVMVAGMQAADGRVRAVHLTYLAPDGRGKAEVVDPETGEVLPAKKMRGAPWGCAIRLAPAAEAMGFGEGIETSGSVQIAAGLPCWAAGSLGNLAGAGKGRGRRHPTRVLDDGRPMLLPSALPDMDRPGIILPVLPLVSTATLLEDADSDPHVMAALMERASRRYAAEGRRVERARPPEGFDFNDLMRGAA